MTGNRRIIRRINGVRSLTVNGKTIDLANKVRDFAVIIDKYLNFQLSNK